MLFHRRYSLTIQDPCHEKWQQMQPAGQGRYCGHCSKTVTDFTGKTEKEIADFFKHRPQQVCGRFRQEQLEKIYTAPVIQVLPVHRRVARYLLGMLLTGAAVDKAKAQEPATTVLQKDSLLTDSALAITPAVQPDSLELACDTITSPADSLTALPLKVNLEWNSGICVSTGTYVIGPEIIVLGAISMAPPERINPLNYLLDSLELIARKTRLKRAAEKRSPVATIAESHVNDHAPRKRRQVPVRLPLQEAVMPIALEWKPQKGGRIKNR